MQRIALFSQPHGPFQPQNLEVASLSHVDASGPLRSPVALLLAFRVGLAAGVSHVRVFLTGQLI